MHPTLGANPRVLAQPAVKPAPRFTSIWPHQRRGDAQRLALPLPTSYGEQVNAVTPWLRRILLINLICQVGIILTGGLVRLTGSGLGCPTWPQCVPGSFTPVAHQEQGIHKFIEFGNRTLTFILVVASIAALVAVLRWARPRRDLIWAAGSVVFGVFAQAAIGGVTVLTGLSPITVSIHFVVSALLVLAAAYLYLRAGESHERISAAPRIVHLVGWLTCAVGALVIVLGTVVTGSGPHSGDADQPNRFGFDPRSVAWLHADAVMLLIGLVVAMVLACALVATPRARRAWSIVLLVCLAQGLIGYTQYFTGLPIALVAIHMVGAGVLVIALVNGLLALHNPVTDAQAVTES